MLKTPYNIPSNKIPPQATSSKVSLGLNHSLTVSQWWHLLQDTNTGVHSCTGVSIFLVTVY